MTSANVNDVTMTSQLLIGEESIIYGDSGYLGADKQEEAITKNKAGKHIRYKLDCRPSQIKKHSPKAQEQLKRREHKKSSVRAKAEHAFGVVKGQLQYRKARYRGAAKVDRKMQ